MKTSSDVERDISTGGQNAGDAVKGYARSAAETVAGGLERTQHALGDAGGAIRDRAARLSTQAGEAAEDLAEAGGAAARSVARTASDQPLLTLLVGLAAGYALNSWLHHD